jgi:D-cysteine desulfhydrase family pyridoxal phosphate-dependent enzyme
MNRCQFAALPTPIQRLTRLEKVLNGPELFIKRDDLTGLSFGGNKTRKLEYVMADALAQKADVIISVGGIQSNHVRQTAAVCAKFGLECRLILNQGDSEIPPSGNLFLNDLFGAKVIFCTPDEQELCIQTEMQRVQESGKKAFFIPLGASTAIGAYAYHQAFQEVMTQDDAFNWIVLASGSGGTHAGLLYGALRSKWVGNIYGVSILFPKALLENRIYNILHDMDELLPEFPVLQEKQLFIDESFLGDGYGIMGNLERDAIRLFAMQEGILLDPVYTGRAAGGMLKLISDGYFSKGQRVLFWHTGGTPALFCEKYRRDLVSG